MKVVAAYLLALLGGNTSPTAEDLKKILGSVTVKFGADAEDDKIELLLSEVKGKDITELIASGREKLASVPSGGGGVAVAAAAGGATAPAAAAAAESKKEEKVEEKEESDDVRFLLTCPEFNSDFFYYMLMTVFTNLFCRTWVSVCLTKDHEFKHNLVSFFNVTFLVASLQCYYDRVFCFVRRWKSLI
ncbi:putative ribosomal protein L12 family [Helianthus anomalus]